MGNNGADARCEADRPGLKVAEWRARVARPLESMREIPPRERLLAVAWMHQQGWSMMLAGRIERLRSSARRSEQAPRSVRKRGRAGGVGGFAGRQVEGKARMSGDGACQVCDGGEGPSAERGRLGESEPVTVQGGCQKS